MNTSLAIALILLFSSTIFAQHADMKMGQAEKPAALRTQADSLRYKS